MATLCSTAKKETGNHIKFVYTLMQLANNNCLASSTALANTGSPSSDVSRAVDHVVFGSFFCILQAIKNWSRGRPGNKDRGGL